MERWHCCGRWCDLRVPRVRSEDVPMARCLVRRLLHLRGICVRNLAHCGHTRPGGLVEWFDESSDKTTTPECGSQPGRDGPSPTACIDRRDTGTRSSAKSPLYAEANRNDIVGAPTRSGTPSRYCRHGRGGEAQLACAYVQDNLTQFDFVWWLRSNQHEILAADYEAMATALSLSVKSRDRRVAVEAWLNRHSGWLLIFDDVTDAAQIQEFLPRNTGIGKVILTTREKLDVPLSLIELKDWSLDEAVAFLQTSAAGPRESMKEIAHQLFNVPLALDQAAAYMKATGIDGPNYLRLSRNNSEELLKLGKAFNRDDSIATTWAISIDLAEHEVPGARDLLVLCSFYSGNAIPRQLPPLIAETKQMDHPAPHRFRRRLSDEVTYNNMLAALSRQSLLIADVSNLYVHGLVQRAIRASLTPRARDDWTCYAAETLFALLMNFDRDNDSPEAVMIAELLLPHVLSVAQRAEDNVPKKWPYVFNWPSWTAVRESAGSLTAIAYYLRDQPGRKTNQAITLRALELAVEAWPFLLGFQNPNEIDTVRAVANASEAVAAYAGMTGDTAEAETALRKALALFTEKAPPRRQNPLRSGRRKVYNRVGLNVKYRVLLSLIRILIATGKSEEALDLARKAQKELTNSRYIDPEGKLIEQMTALSGTGEVGNK